MIRNTFKVLPIICLTILLAFPNCGKPVKTPAQKADIAQELIEKLNHIPLGITFQVEPANVSVEPAAQDRYLVTFKNSSTLIDTSIFKQLNTGLQLKTGKIPVKTEEIVYKYGPEEKYLEIVSLKGMSVEWDISKVLIVPDANKAKPLPSEMTVWFSIGSAEFQNYNVSPLLDTKAQNLLELLGAMMGKITSVRYTVNNLGYGVRGEENQKKMSFQIEAEKIEGSQKILPEVFISIYLKATQPPNLAKFLEQGSPLLDLSMKFSTLKISFTQGGNLQGEGTAQNLDFSYFLKPNSSKSFFVYGFDWDLKNVKLTVPGNKDLEAIGNIDEMNMKFSLENLSTSFVEAYLNLLRKSMELSGTMDKEKIHQQQMMMGMTIASEFMKSQPVIKCSFAPLKHSLGEMQADIDIKFLNLMAPPVGKAAVTFPKIEETLARIKTSLSGTIAEKLIKMAKDYLVFDKQGNGRITFEIKQDQPGKFFLNGKPVMK